MKRRNFLQAAGVIGATGSSGLAGGNAQTGETSQPCEVIQNQPDQKRVLVTSADSPLAQAVAAELDTAYRVRLTSSLDVPATQPFTRSDLGHDESTNTLVRGTDAIVHVATPPGGSERTRQIDHRTRCTYNLLMAAAEEGVQTVVYLSSLEILLGYDEDYEVTEDWKPLISSQSVALSDYLGEFTCREFAHESRLRVVVLRLGRVVRRDEVRGKPFDPLWVEQQDVTRAIAGTLCLSLGDTELSRRRWTILHIGSGSPDARFTSQRAAQLIEYQPQFNWE